MIHERSGIWQLSRERKREGNEQAVFQLEFAEDVGDSSMIEVVLDSGASVPVISVGVADDVPTKQTKLTKKCTLASKQSLRNTGQKIGRITFENGAEKK